METSRDFDATIVGGCGHVGLPLAVAFASRGLNVAILDINEAAVEPVRSGEMPFREDGTQEVLRQTLADGRLHVTTDSEVIGRGQAYEYDLQRRACVVTNAHEVLGLECTTPLDDLLDEVRPRVTGAVAHGQH